MLNARTIAGNQSSLALPLNVPPGGRSRIVAVSVDAANDSGTQQAVPTLSVVTTAGVVLTTALAPIAITDLGQYWITFDGGGGTTWAAGSETRQHLAVGLRAWWDDNDGTSVRVEIPNGRATKLTVWSEDLPPATRRRRVTNSGDMTTPG